MSAIVNLKNLFQKKAPAIEPFKRHHYLNSLPTKKLNEILIFSEGDHFNKLFPVLKNKKVLFLNDQNHSYLMKKLLSHQPDYLVNYVYQGLGIPENQDNYASLMGTLDNIGLKNNFFDVVICPFVLQDDIFNNRVLQKLSKIVKNGGQILFAFRHPQLEAILYNQNPSATGAPDNSVAKYFNMLKTYYLYTESLHEGCVDEALRPFFTSEGDYDYYHEYKNIPMSLFFCTVKFFNNKTAPQ